MSQVGLRLLPSVSSQSHDFPLHLLKLFPNLTFKTSSICSQWTSTRQNKTHSTSVSVAGGRIRQPASKTHKKSKSLLCNENPFKSVLNIKGSINSQLFRFSSLLCFSDYFPFLQGRLEDPEESPVLLVAVAH